MKEFLFNKWTCKNGIVFLRSDFPSAPEKAVGPCS